MTTAVTKSDHLTTIDKILHKNASGTVFPVDQVLEKHGSQQTFETETSQLIAIFLYTIHCHKL